MTSSTDEQPQQVTLEMSQVDTLEAALEAGATTVLLTRKGKPAARVEAIRDEGASNAQTLADVLQPLWRMLDEDPELRQTIRDEHAAISADLDQRADSMNEERHRVD
ncbi:MAG: hypothetical protein AAF743_02860 [Planctomycetota bacterium]